MSLPCLRNIKAWLEFPYQVPLVVAHIGSVKFLERVNALARNGRVEQVLFVNMAAVYRLVRAFDFNCHTWLPLFAHWNLLVIALDGLPAVLSVSPGFKSDWNETHTLCPVE
jgi:hypothetical protein